MATSTSVRSFQQTCNGCVAGCEACGNKPLCVCGSSLCIICVLSKPTSTRCECGSCEVCKDFARNVGEIARSLQHGTTPCPAGCIECARFSAVARQTTRSSTCNKCNSSTCDGFCACPKCSFTNCTGECMCMKCSRADCGNSCRCSICDDPHCGGGVLCSSFIDFLHDCPKCFTRSCSGNCPCLRCEQVSCNGFCPCGVCGKNDCGGLCVSVTSPL